MKCSYCGGETTSFEKCTCCGSPVSPEDLEAESERIIAAYQSNKNESDDGKNLLGILHEMAKRGNFKKQDVLGKILLSMAQTQHDEGKTTPSEFRSLLAAVHMCFLSGANGGNVVCMLKIAECYHYGIGCEKDEKQYRFWLKKAAEEGNEEAKDLLRDLESSSNEVVTPEVSSSSKWGIIGTVVAAVLVVIKLCLAFIR